MRDRSRAEQLRRIAEIALIALLAFAAVGTGIRGVGIGSGENAFFVFGAEDEVVYGHAAARMVSTGQWGTSVYLGRLLLNKPPLLMWSGATAMRLFGVSPGTLRLPVVLAGALCCVLLYLWMRRTGQPVATACTATILLAGNPFLHLMARKFMTDMLLTLWITLAAFVLGQDLRLQRRWSAFAYGALSGAAIMTKSAAGLIPLMVLGLYWLVAGKQERPAFRRVLIACGSAVVVAAPWHVYEFVVHRDWFVTEYLKIQLIGVGIALPAPAGEPKLWFYLRALALSDPVLAVLSLTALPALAMAWKGGLARLLTSWIAVVAICLAAFSNRSTYYVLPVVPALALLSARFSPLVRGRRTAWLATGILLAVFCVKAGVPDRVWGLDFRQGTTVRAASALDAYARLNRANELVVVSPDDQLYSSVIDLPKVRYAWIAPSIDYFDTPRFLYWLGIIVTADELCRPVNDPLYAQRLRAWGAPDSSAMATVAMARSGRELADAIRCSPQRDFFLPDDMESLAREAGLPAHRLVRLGAERFFLLATDSSPRPKGPPVPGTLVFH